ncbi:FIP1[V]-like protein [Camellia lanceoleosa]|uniref:FIP1[V]-like protein n=1 Tax=Camellia lanceoleosa TaxID=1840588 RepID=A0ACC0GTC4_9ERIC|nr:FIP1[V]-like protein [Camellia lanceoleosa]
MEDIDDDFGDLYADIEVQASKAVNDKSNFSRLYIEQDDNNTKCIDSVSKNVDVLIQDDDEAKRDSSVGVDNGSDSEDDLNIVLNDVDGDGSVYPVARGLKGIDEVEEEEEEEEEDGGLEVLAEGDGLELSPNGRGMGGDRGNGGKGSYQSQYLQYKYIRPHAASFPFNSKTNGSAAVAPCSSASVRGDWDDNKCNQRMASSSLVAQSGHNFSLPWYRTILDVNIDTFERKPWRHPRADITDFFNFGFDEESWKCYCNRLDQLRQQTSLLTRTSVHDFSKPKDAYEAGAEYETGSHETMPEKVAHIGQWGTVSPASKIAYRETKQLEVPKGRVIQVEDNILERQPSMDVRRLVDRDPDVVIQIAVQDSMEDSSGLGKVELTHKDGSAHEASENEDFGLDDDRVDHHFGSGSGDELSREFSEENVKRSSRYFPKRCSQVTNPSNRVSVDSDIHGSDQISDVNGHFHRKVTGSSSVGNAEAMETSNNTKEKVCRDTCNAAPYMGETESLLGEQTQSSSYSGSHCEASGDDASTDPERFQNNLRQQSPNSVTELKELATCDYYHPNDSKNHRGRTKSHDCKYYARNRSPIPQDLKHYNRRLNGVSELKSHHDYEYASPLSNTDRIYDSNYTAVGHSRHDKRHHGLDSFDREDFTYYKESKFSFNYYGERFSYNQVHAAYSKKPCRNRQSPGDETDRYLRRRWDEGEYCLEERVSRADDEVIMGRDWHNYVRGPTFNPFICKESRQLDSNYSPYLDKERVTRCRRVDEFQFRKRLERDDFLFDHEYQDDFMQEKYGYYDKDRKYMNGKYERPLPSSRRGGKSSSRSERKYDSPSIDLDNSWAIPYEDEYWKYGDHRSLSSRSYGEPHTSNRGKRLDTISPTNAYDLRLTERHGRHMRQILKERGRGRGSDWFGSNHDACDTEGSINYHDGQVDFGRRRWQSDSLYWTEREYISRHEDDEFLAEEASFPFGGTSRHRRFYAKRKLIDDGEVEQCRIKLTNKGNSSKRIERSSNIISRGKHEKTALRCRDSDDLQLVVEERKSSGRCSNARSMMHNVTHANMDRNIDKEQIVSTDYKESHTEEAGEADNTEGEINQKDEKWLDKFPVTQHNEALDIEEGQIITEVNENPVVEKFKSEDVAEISVAKKKTLRDENAAKHSKVGEGFDSPQILEVIAKMEKRRERFKEPITLKKETDSVPNPQVDPVVETTETKQQRPARKRRWGGS